VKEIVACPFPATAMIFVGASGALKGVTELLASDATLVPTSFVAVTVNVYDTPFVNPVTVIGEVPPFALKPPVFEVTVYEVIGKLPLFTGAVNEIVASPFPLTATTFVGASGTVAGVIVLLALDEILVPITFVAVTVNEYAVPFDRPVIVIGVVPPVALKPPVFEVTV
jgi:hypothetical protein